MPQQRLRDLNLDELINRKFHPSPTHWEDQVLYFLLVDRFSDGRETGYRDNEGDPGGTARFLPEDAGNAVQTEAEARQWREAGGSWVGGTLRGIRGKLGYLRRLGVTALWISPVFKQARFQDSYHGYGIQDFLEIDPHYGTREELRDLVAAAHEQGIYVVLDIILNHAGDVFRYAPDRYLTVDGDGNAFLDPRWDGRPYAVRGFHDETGAPTLPFGEIDLNAHPTAWPDGAIWPAEFQAPETFTQRGQITNWDYDPEFLEGDFFGLKDIHHGSGPLDEFQPSAALRALCEVYKYWIAYADIDGYRIDTVKHMDKGATRYFASVMHEFTQAIGKENFYLIGEITGGRQRAFETLELTGLNAALGIDDVQEKLESLVKGARNPGEYFRLFRNSELVQKDSHVWFRDKVVTMFDDHDQVRKGENKARFCADGIGARLILNALALNATSLGIPCIYYGSEQAFDGAGGGDRYIREAMFGGAFGPFRSRDRHCFREDFQVYEELAKILAIRRERLPLRRGRQFLRMISGDGVHFGEPEMIGGRIRSVVPWSRIFDGHEIVLAINTDPDEPRTAWVAIEDELHPADSSLTCLYSTAPAQIGQAARVEARSRKAIQLSVPPAGFVIFA
ncbi:MAG: alpha-amylase family glycosyl hydrolase [Blastocatellia bacterium]|nr:alpha-amylase family glycosyl hydrolase [Blastocatellia bacterium]